MLYRGRRYVAYYPAPVSELKRYLTELSDVEKGQAAAELTPGLFSYWIDDERPELFGYAPDDPNLQRRETDDAQHDLRVLQQDPNWPAMFDDADWADFWAYVKKQSRAHYMLYDEETDVPLLPSYFFMDYVGDVQNQWLIHFTDDAHGVAARGFERGTPDHTMLGLTTQFHKRDEWPDYEPDPARMPEGPGFNFAFRLSDYVEHGGFTFQSGEVEWSYGGEAVLFRASGVEVFHRGDDQPQIIFWGPSARDFVPVTVPVTSCRGGHVLARTETLPESVNWIVDNFDQYRRHLVCT